MTERVTPQLPLVAPARRPEAVRSIKLDTLEPYHRALLAIDGTVTLFLEAFHLEPITAELRKQSEVRLTRAHQDLEAEPGTEVIDRRISLRGNVTGTLYADAHSLIVPVRLPLSFQQQLQKSPAGIGAALASLKLESRRELLWYGVSDTDQDLLVRCYRVITSGRPAMVIEEHFPLAGTTPRQVPTAA